MAVDPSTHNVYVAVAYAMKVVDESGDARNGLAPGTDRVAFQSCTAGPYPLTYSNPVTVTAAGLITVNEPLHHS